MKLKKVLASILAVAMVLSTMSFSVFAEEKAQISGTIAGCAIEDYTGDSYIFSEITGLNATESVVVKLFDANETLLATTTLQKHEYFVIDSLTVKFCIADTSSSWTTVWEEGKCHENYVPAKMTLYVDGIEMNSTKANIWTPAEQPISWGDVNGVIPAFALNRVEAENAMKEDDLSAQSILITFNNVPCIDKNMTVQLYHDDELLSTTNATAKRLGQAYSELTTNVVYSGDAAISGSWTTEINAPWTIDRAPNKIVVDIDGIETTFTNFEIAAFSKFEKFDLTAGSITVGYTNNTSVWGEGGANAKESFVVELYAEEEKIGQASLNDYEDIIDGDLYVTWNINFAGEDSEYWTVDWYGNNPSVDTVPTKVVLLADGVKVAENIVKMCAPDDLNPVKWDELEGVSAAARIGKKGYSSVKAAIADAEDGDTISLIYNEGDAPIAMNGALYGNKTVSITGDAVVDWSKGSLFVGRGGEGNGKLIFDNANLTSTEASLKNGTYGIHVSMEEYGASNKADGEVVFKNSNIDLSYLMNKNNVTVDGGNLTVWCGFAVGARPASETNNVQRAAELKLSNNAVVEVKNHNGMGIGYESNGIANIDAGSTLKISAASLAVAANSTVNSKGNIIGLLDVADGATMNFTDGFYTEDPSAYCAEGYEVDKSEVEGYAYTVVPKAAQKINVVFENGKNEGEYILKLKSADEKEIYKFVSAELTFKNNSESLGDAIGTLPFEFVENTNIDVEKSLEDANTYAFALKNPANRITATEIELGTIKFTSQGTPALAVTAGTVVATRYNTNLPKYYSTDAELNGEGLTLDISATLDGTPVPDTTRDVAVKIEYNLGLVGGVWADDEIEVTLVDKFGDEVTATKVSNGLFTFEDVATGRIEVKLSAPGFRTYTYDAILYETEEENNPLVLNFWNNVKTGEDEDPLKKIDDSNAIEKEMAHNFVVGDIVMDFIVDRYDLAAVTSYYGMYNITERTNASEKYLKYDLNRDGNIDIIDVHYVLHTFGN